ncbi:DNA-binding NarL/FixJ family response regulator [Oxalobacteraceae bacterium GrIS 2.11]
MNVCVVEDSVLIQDRIKRMIEQLPGTTVVSIASDRKSAEKLLMQSAAGGFQVLILDTQLPDGNGLELVKKVKQIHPDIKVVIFSNHASDECRFLAERAGADRFLDKSTDSELLVPVLQNWQ